jgi:transcriptional regulator with XRE-family HTH domain
MPEVMLNTDEAVLHRKIMGVKIRHARAKAGMSAKEVGDALGLSAQVVNGIELGQHEASLPQLEVMAFLFNIPLVYFWTEDPIEEIDWNFPTLEALALRRRIIGVLLRRARLEAGRSLEDLAQSIGVSTGQIAGYELGKVDIPIQKLQALGTYLNLPLDYFVDEGIKADRLNGRTVTLDEITQFSQLSPEVREFLLNPANLLYVNIAMRLSGMSAETLRSLAEGLLEVTY